MNTAKLPSKLKIIEDIQKNVPPELLEQNIWLAYYFKENKNGTFSKPPCTNKGYSVENNFKGVSFEQACQDGYPGIKISIEEPLIAFDVDDKDAKLGKRPFNIDALSPEFKAFLAQHKPYMELSPSKCGLRVLMKCEDKLALPGRASLSETHCIGGELYLSSGYVTITGDKLSGIEIPSITSSKLTHWYLSKPKQEQPKQNNVIPLKPEHKINDLPSLVTFRSALHCCTLDQSARVRKAYQQVFNTGYDHYDYWMKILAAAHNYATLSGQMNEILFRVMEWSKTDSEAFQGEEDVVNHWTSFDANKEKGVTYATVFKLANLLQFKWPQEAYDNKGNATGKPLVNSVKNFEYLMSYYSIEFSFDIFDGSIYVTADQDIMDEYFTCYEGKKYFFGMVGPFSQEEILGIMWELTQSNKYDNVTYSTISPLVKKYLQKNTKEINMLEKWLETDAENLSEDMLEHGTDLSCSNLDYLLSCIEYNSRQNVEMARKYFETFFYEMMMPIYNKERKYSQRSFMLVLTGPEACRKTTFFSMLFPPKLRTQFVTNSTETLGGAKSIRDFSSSLVSSALVVTDEFEIFYNKKNDSLFKTYVTSDVIDYVPIYEKTMKKAYKNAVIAGTTNKRSLPFEQDSNRRLALVEVKFIDTSAMEKINWHHFYREFIKKGYEHMARNEHPWKLDKEFIRTQYQENEQFRSLTNLEIMLTEIFDFNMETHKEPLNYNAVTSVQNDERLWKIGDITGKIKQVYPDAQISPTAMRHILKRYCGRYTKTTDKKLILRGCAGHIENGMLMQSQFKRYIMPPVLTDF